MPFFWRRRNKNWYGRFRRQRFRKYKRRRWPRRRYRRPARRRRRRRRRRHKVRRKKQTITLKQWQPDSIRKCKIKGFNCIVAGAEGRQYFCYTNEKTNYIQPKAPGGGGFGVELYSLDYLYTQWLKKQNIWTHTNEYKDLVRYQGCRVTFFRHEKVDFVVQYQRQPPFLIQKHTYMQCHPQNLLLTKHHKVILSKKHKPNGKNTVSIFIKPPKQTISKWFFQDEFSKYGLFQLQAAAATFGYPTYGPNTQSTNLTFYALNTRFYHNTDWAQEKTGQPGYKPYTNYTDSIKFHYPTQGGGSATTTADTSSYTKSIDYSTGVFQSKILLSTKIEGTTTYTHERPITIARYNPEDDNGVGNSVYLVSIIADTGWAEPKDKDLVIHNVPLYIAFYGFWNYILKVKGDKNFLKYHMFVVKSEAIKLVVNTEQKEFPILDWSFITGKMPYGELLTDSDKRFWYPTSYKQQEIINAIVECGPYIPKLSNQPSSTWQLYYKYCFYFKWGGPQITDQLAENPKEKGKYDVPDTVFETVQITNPNKQSCKSMLRAWDYRRGIITQRALKRMSEDIQTDSSFEPDDAETPKKKKKATGELPAAQEENQKMQACLLSLFEESTCQDQENLQQLIQHQQQQQQKIKHNILNLLLDLKKKQRIIQMQSGLD
nr:MAG: ORF1 [Torque teno midi virus]